MTSWKIIRTYSYDELDEAAKEKVKENLSYHLDSIDYQGIFADILSEKGFPTDKIGCSLSYCQGDGVAFYGTVDWEKFLTFSNRRTHYRRLPEMDILIYPNSFGAHYSHYNTMDIQLDYYSATPKQIELVKEFREELTEAIRSTSKELERMGYKEIESAYSDDHVSELCYAFDYKFTKNGELA